MTRSFRLLRRCARGASSIEFALAAPLFLLLIFGTVQIGLIFWANVGMKHALEEAARMATLDPTPTDTQLRSHIANERFGLTPANIGAVTISRGTLMGTKYADIAMTYEVPLDFALLTIPGVTLTEQRRVFYP